MIRSFLTLAVLALGLITSSVPAVADAQGFGRLLKGIVSLGADVADDVPVSSLQRGFRRADPPGHLPKLSDGKALRRALQAADPDLSRQLDALPPADAAIALRMFAGAEALLKASPDALARVRAMERGGADLILAAERYGDEMTGPAFRILAAEDIGQLPKGSLQRFSETVATRGKQVLDVWNKQVLPNWKELAAAGLLADILFNDGELISATGELVLKKGTEIVIDTSVAIPKAIATTVWEKLQGPDGAWVAFVVALLALPIAIWLFRRAAWGLRVLTGVWGFFYRQSRWVGRSTPSDPSPHSPRNRLTARSKSTGTRKK